MSCFYSTGAALAWCRENCTGSTGLILLKPFRGCQVLIYYPQLKALLPAEWWEGRIRRDSAFEF